MSTTFNRSFVLVLALAACLLSLPAPVRAEDWPAWRGPAGTGVCTEKNLPVTWSKTQNVRWRTALPEPGNSTPIVWQDRVLLTQQSGRQRTLMCLDRASGSVLWQQGVPAQIDKEPTHGTNPYCSSSPVTDGQRVIAWFGSDGLHAFDLEGKKLWSRDLGVQKHIWGYGSSPVIAGELCILNFGPGERSFLIALDKKTGQTVWQKEEQENKPDKAPGQEKGASDAQGGKAPPPGGYYGSWTTPILVTVEGRQQLVMSWPKRLVALDPASGNEIWRCGGLNQLVYTSPVAEGETVAAMGGFGGMALAVRAGGSGEVTESRRLWHHPKTRQRIGSGVIHEGHIYIHTDPGLAQCIELATGRLVWEEPLRNGAGKGATNWSSVLLAGGKCYTINQAGDGFVFRASPKFELLSVNPLGERSNSSIAASDGELFIRTHQALWCIAEKKP